MDRSPKLVVCIEPFGNKEIPLRSRRMSIGRGNDQDICLPDRKISSAHALLETTDTGYRLRDLGSTNGTYVNGALVDGLVGLALGDEIRFGNTLVLFTDKDLAEIGDWPGEPPIGAEMTELELDPAVQTVKFRLPDLERELLSSDEGAGSVRLQRKLQVLHRVTVLTRGMALSARILMDEALKLVFEVIDADRGAFFLRGADGELQEMASLARRKKGGDALGTDPPDWGVSRSILAQVLQSGEAIVTRDAQQDQRFNANMSIHRANIHSALAVPLRAQEEIMGVLHLDKREARRPFGEDDLHLAVIIAQQLAASLHNAQLFDAVNLANRELEAARDEILRWNQDLERKVAERTSEVQAQAAQIEELMHQKDQLLGMVAHDLRTPLAGLLGFAEVAIAGLEAGLEAEKTKEDLDVIRTTALEMSDLLNDLLDVSRLEAGKLHIDPREIDLLELIRKGAKRYEVMAGQKQIGFTQFLPDGQLTIRADPKRVNQILGNLISNAIKFSNPGARISLTVRSEATRVLVSVADTGQGISPSDADRIFGQFEQAEAQATAGEHGSGLGLSIAKKLLELHGGKIWVDSKPGMGACFTFTLPL